MKINLLELDSFEYQGKSYRVGQSISFKNDFEIEKFIKDAKQVTRSYTIYPFLWGIFGGVVKKVRYKVWVRMDQ